MVEAAISQAEQDQAILQQYEHEFTPYVLMVAEMQEEIEAQRRAQRLYQAAGSTALQQTVELSPSNTETQSVSRYPTLMHAIKGAARGEREGLAMVVTEAKTDTVERTIKAGQVMRVSLQTDGNDKIIQHGQLMDDVQINSLRYASASDKMKRRTMPEMRNSTRIEVLYQQGTLEDYNFVVISRCADDMSDAELDAAGFFVDTKSCAIQVTSSLRGELTTESAFVAGVRQRDDARHDAQTVVGMAATLGVDLSSKSAAEIIDTPLLIHKSLMPNGAVDLVKMYDDAAGGTFFGQDKPRQDYVAYLDVCRERERTFEPKVHEIVNKLLSEAHTINTPEQAVDRLHKLSQAKMVDQAIADRSIDPRVFGAEAAAHIEAARYWLEQGDTDRVIDARNEAQATARSSSCPKAGVGQGGDDGNSSSGGEKGESSELKMIKCPFCNTKQIKDPCAKVLACKDCFAMACYGVIVDKGNGGTEKRGAERAEARAAKAAEQAETQARLRAQQEIAIAPQVEQAFAEQNVTSFEDEQRHARKGQLALSGVQ